MQNFFVLSGAPEFGRESGEHSFEEFFKGRLDVMSALKKRFPKKHAALKEYYDEELFDAVLRIQPPTLQPHQIETSNLLDEIENAADSDVEELVSGFSAEEPVPGSDAGDPVEVVGAVDDFDE